VVTGAVVVHGTFALTRRLRHVPEPHTQSPGDPWPFWESCGLSLFKVRLVTEPTALFLAGSLCSNADPFLSLWLKACAASLFLKHAIIALRLRRRVMDAADGRIEAQEFNAALNRYLSPRESRRRRQQHRARLP